MEITRENLDKYFIKSDLIPAIAVDVRTGQVLMLAYMNQESLRKTLETGYTWYWSRSRQELWNKGATSGHLQKVISIFADCDDDTLLVYRLACSEVAHLRAFNGSNLYLSSLYVEREHGMPRHLALPANQLKFVLLLVEDFYLLLRHLVFLRFVKYFHIA